MSSFDLGLLQARDAVQKQCSWRLLLTPYSTAHSQRCMLTLDWILHSLYTVLDHGLFWRNAVCLKALSWGRWSSSHTQTKYRRSSSRVADTGDWCAFQKLKLNATKTEIAWFCSRPNLNKISGSHCSLSVGCDVIKPKDVVRDLGVYLDSELSLKQHISKVENSCFYHLRWLCQIRRSTGNDVMIQLVVAFVLSQIDYCNAILAAGLPWTAIEPLQRAQNAAAHLIFGLWSSDHINHSVGPTTLAAGLVSH